MSAQKVAQARFSSSWVLGFAAAHVLIGVWGRVAGRSAGGAASYCRLAGMLDLALTVVGFVSPGGFGFLPLGGNDRWLHLVLGLVLARRVRAFSCRRE